MSTSSSFLIADFSNNEFPTIQKFPHFTQRMVMPVVAFKGADIRPLGTCFSVSNHGIVLTARHVIDEAVEIMGWTRGGGKIDNGWGVGAVFASEADPDMNTKDIFGGILPARSLNFQTDLDIGIMHLNLPVNSINGKQLTLPISKITPGLPNIGDLCFGLGYHSMEWAELKNGVHTHSVIQSYSATRGVIEEIHFPKRDMSSLRFPCFQTSARFDGGMSGGPIFNESGGIIGVICSSFKLEGTEGYISYGSLMGPALLLQLDALIEGGILAKKFLYDFINGGAVLVDESIKMINIKREGDKIELDFGRKEILVGMLQP